MANKFDLDNQVQDKQYIISSLYTKGRKRQMKAAPRNQIHLLPEKSAFDLVTIGSSLWMKHEEKLCMQSQPINGMWR